MFQRFVVDNFEMSDGFLIVEDNTALDREVVWIGSDLRELAFY
jgi:hypothetical protein